MDLAIGTRRRVATTCAAIWGAGVLVAAFTLPVYSAASVTADADGGLEQSSGGATLVEVNGTGVLLVAAAPVVAALAVAVLLGMGDGRRWSVAVAWLVIALLAGLAVLSLLTVGVLILPVVVALAIATDSRVSQRSSPAGDVRSA